SGRSPDSCAVGGSRIVDLAAGPAWHPPEQRLAKVPYLHVAGHPRHPTTTCKQQAYRFQLPVRRGSQASGFSIVRSKADRENRPPGGGCGRLFTSLVTFECPLAPLVS